MDNPNIPNDDDEKDGAVFEFPDDMEAFVKSRPSVDVSRYIGASIEVNLIWDEERQVWTSPKKDKK
jgi:hypothetical protein